MLNIKVDIFIHIFFTLGALVGNVLGYGRYQNQSMSQYYYNESALCHMPYGFFNLSEISNITTNNDLRGEKKNDMVLLYFRPLQVLNLTAKTYSYSFDPPISADFKNLISTLNLEFFIDIPAHSIPKLKYICGTDYHNFKTWYGDTENYIPNLRCTNFPNHMQTNPNLNFIGLRIVQENSYRLAVYELYNDFSIKIYYSEIIRLNNLVFDLTNITANELFFVHLVNVIIKDCAYERTTPDQSNVRHFNYKFNSKLVLYYGQICPLVDEVGIYDVIEDNGYIWNNLFLTPMWLLNSSFTKLVELRFRSGFSIVSTNKMIHTLKFFPRDHIQIARAIQNWKGFSMNLMAKPITINKNSNANCLIHLQALRNVSLTLSFLDYENITVRVIGTRLSLQVDRRIFPSYTASYDYYFLRKAVCRTSSETNVADIFSLDQDYTVLLYSTIEKC